MYPRRIFSTKTKPNHLCRPPRTTISMYLHAKCILVYIYPQVTIHSIHFSSSSLLSCSISYGAGKTTAKKVAANMEHLFHTVCMKPTNNLLLFTQSSSCSPFSALYLFLLRISNLFMTVSRYERKYSISSWLYSSSSESLSTSGFLTA